MEAEATGHHGEGVCTACPICAGLAAVRTARPELLEHLARAGGELLAAARAILKAAGGSEPPPEKAQRIDVG